MQPRPDSNAALDSALSLARSAAALLSEANADGIGSYHEALSRCSGGPLPLRRLREEQNLIALRLLDRLSPTLDRMWVELGELDTQLSPRDRRLAIAAWRAIVQPYFLRAPLARRSVDKPLGYPGDFGMVNYIYDAPEGSEDPLGSALERYIWNVGPCRAHRQRRPWALGHLAALRTTLGRPLRVISYACGPEHTLQAWAAMEPETEIDVYDAEPLALAWCQARFDEIAGRAGRPLHVRSHVVSPRGLLDGSAPLAGPVDAVLVLGLFDYLGADAIGALVDQLSAVLAPGGRLLCSNLHEPNPWRTFMEYVGAWKVEHRTRARLEGEVLRARTDLRLRESRLDDSGTNVFVAVERVGGI